MICFTLLLLDLIIIIHRVLIVIILAWTHDLCNAVIVTSTNAEATSVQAVQNFQTHTQMHTQRAGSLQQIGTAAGHAGIFPIGLPTQRIMQAQGTFISVEYVNNASGNQSVVKVMTGDEKFIYPGSNNAYRYIYISNKPPAVADNPSFRKQGITYLCTLQFHLNFNIVKITSLH